MHVDSDVEISTAFPSQYLTVRHYAACHDENGLNLEPYVNPQLNDFFYKSCHGHSISFQQ